MEVSGLVLLAMIVALLVSTPLLGRYLAVYGGASAPGDRVFAPVEPTSVYRPAAWTQA